MEELKKTASPTSGILDWRYADVGFMEEMPVEAIEKLASILRAISVSGPQVIDGYRYWVDSDRQLLRREKDYSEYDSIADTYQGLFNDVASLKENKEITDFLKANFSGSVYEIGCGSGLLLDYCNIPTNAYLGIDPSSKMLGYFKQKHPHHQVKILPFEIDGDVFQEYDNVVALFGAASYLPKRALARLSTYRGGVFMMFYKDTYEPVTYQLTKTTLHHHKYSKAELEAIFPQCSVSPVLNYFVVSSKPTTRL